MALVKPRKEGPPPAAPADGDPLAGLEDRDPAVRRRAAHGLAQRPDGAAALALGTRLGREEDPSVREAILTALVRTGVPEAAAALTPLLASEDVALRNGAIESLQQMPAGIVAPAVLPLMEAADPDVRLFAVQLLGKLVHPDRLRWLTGAMERDPHVNVCLAAVEALVETGHPETLPSLERLAARFPDDPFVTFSVDAARRRFAEN